MYRAKWIFLIGLAIFLAGLLHYSLPGRDIVRITEKGVKRVDGAAAADGTATNRDVSFIYAEFPDGSVIAYRNEDTDWGWPPYFKFDTQTLSSKAASVLSTKEDPTWVVVKHYGWRIPMFSIFENAISIREAEGPNEELTPWSLITMLLVIAVVVFFMRRAILSVFGWLGIRRGEG